MTNPNDKQVGGNHYRDGDADYQHWDFIIEYNVPYLLAQITRYTIRAQRKTGVVDLQKALHYAEKISSIDDGQMLLQLTSKRIQDATYENYARAVRDLCKPAPLLDGILTSNILALAAGALGVGPGATIGKILTRLKFEINVRTVHTAPSVAVSSPSTPAYRQSAFGPDDAGEPGGGYVDQDPVGEHRV